MKFRLLLCAAGAIFFGWSAVYSQKADAEKTSPLRRTMTRTERASLAMGGTVTIVGAPNGAITVEGWRKNAVEVTAEMEWQGASEADLKTLSEINTFAFDQDLNHVRILTTGTHDREMMKKLGRKVPKHLLEAVWKINFTIKVPAFADLNINGGRGAFRLQGVDGTAFINFLESDAEIFPIGGTVLMTAGAGNVKIFLEGKSFRGQGVDVQLAKGDLTIDFPAVYNAEADFSVLRSGAITNLHKGFQPRERTVFDSKKFSSKIGSGGAKFFLTVGDGNIFINARQTP